MDQRFMTTREVADFLRISSKTLRNYGAVHLIYRPSRPGIWYRAHVDVLERVWAGALSEDEGLAFWEIEKARMRGPIKD